MTAPNLLRAQRLTLRTPGGRLLYRDLSLSLDPGDRVAIIGRNGVGKSTLLRALTGDIATDSGLVSCRGRRRLVPQELDHESSASPGEIRRRSLELAFLADPDLLLLDEPTHDLDRAGLDWLASSLGRWRKGLILVSYDRRLLRDFHDFFVVAEAGCHHFGGSFEALIQALAQDQEQHERRYVGQLNRLNDQERHNYVVHKRRERKKNVGRIRELHRCPARVQLNYKRSYAQEKQAKRRLIQQKRIGVARSWAAATRRALAVDLPLEASWARLPEDSLEPVVRLTQVSERVGDRILFADLSLELRRQRLAVMGPNGSGKSTLIELLAGERRPQQGSARSDSGRIGYIAQNSANWRLDESLLQQLIQVTSMTPDLAASAIRAHQFPFALAERPLVSLSPGERLRAALICLLQRERPPELLILDEPTNHLDFLGYPALQALLSRWPGGLVVASHDEEFRRSIRIDQRLMLGQDIAFDCPQGAS